MKKDRDAVEFDPMIVVQAEAFEGGPVFCGSLHVSVDGCRTVCGRNVHWSEGCERRLWSEEVLSGDAGSYCGACLKKLAELKSNGGAL